MRRITPGQLRVLKAIQDLYDSQGYSPSYGEIAAVLGISSQSVGQHVQAMCDRGVLRKVYGVQNTIEVVKDDAR